jgi:hypothetical protein
MVTFPAHITFISDDSEAKLTGEIIDKKAKERTARYQFTKAKAVKGVEFTMTAGQVEKLINDERVKVK